MSLVDRHAMGMLSSVMRALKHMEATHALRRQHPLRRLSAAAIRSAIGAAMGPVVQPAETVRRIRGFGPLF